MMIFFCMADTRCFSVFERSWDFMRWGIQLLLMSTRAVRYHGKPVSACKLVLLTEGVSRHPEVLSNRWSPLEFPQERLQARLVRSRAMQHAYDVIRSGVSPPHLLHDIYLPAHDQPTQVYPPPSSAQIPGWPLRPQPLLNLKNNSLTKLRS
ncbi:hypothetical protein K474DRAFT_1155094 [Panus rudis PR-1116 ss-1]|nr:hypothetical protein K474DRAFT_1155094 [Panus rudis PR-1116 ss-1]